MWKWSWFDPWKSPKAVHNVEGNLNAGRAVAVPGLEEENESCKLFFLKVFVQK